MSVAYVNPEMFKNVLITKMTINFKVTLISVVPYIFSHTRIFTYLHNIIHNKIIFNVTYIKVALEK